jgi:chorismate lyase / 3-hydroxybenzoate synthase
MTVSVTRQGFSFSFGPAGAAGAERGQRMSVLAGPDHETLFGQLVPAGNEKGFALYASDDWLVGVRMETVGHDLAVQTEKLYTDLIGLSRAHGRALARIWNYVPDINETPAGGLETYRVFCRGRAEAFERVQWVGPVPAASAVGGAPGLLAVMFAAARTLPMAIENPEQIPAYEYPPDYGPRAPSFSRAMQVTADGRQWTFISGTAAIKGHASLARGDLLGQIECTMDNLRLISRACGLVEDNGERHFKVYLRNACDLEAAKAALEGALFRPEDRVTWLHADICRAELLIEIEATVLT